MLRRNTFIYVLAFVFLVSVKSNAYLAPRMYSIIVQGAVSLRQTDNELQKPFYTNKLDLNLLYFVRGGPTFGLRYLIDNRNEFDNEHGEAYGPVAGFYWERGWFFLIHYSILAKLGSWTNGEGAQIDIGYLEHLGGQYHIGFQVSNKRITYSSDINSNLSKDRSVQDTYPSVVLMYLF